MRKLMMKMSISVDSFVSTTNGVNDWIHKTGDEASAARVVELCRSAGLHIMGSKTFEIMASYWPTATDAFAAPMNEIPKAVFTKSGYKGIAPVPNAEQSTAAASWAGARVFDGDLAEGIRELKSEPGKPILAHGGAGFMRSLIAADLIDEYHLFIHPVALGSGLPIFSDLSRLLNLKLVDVKAFPGGVVAHTYHK